jgi:hypothetical protein
MEVPQTVRLEYRMEKGDLLKYKINVLSEQSIIENEETTAHAFSLDMIVAGTVVDRPDRDVYRLRYVCESGTIDHGGATSILPGIGESFMVDMCRNGEIIGSSPAIPFSQPAFPEGDLAPGFSWTGTSVISYPFKNETAGMPKLSLTYTYVLKELSSLVGQQCAIITVTCPESQIRVMEHYEQNISGSGKIYFAYREGRLLGSYIKDNHLITSPDTQISSKVSIKVELMT